VATGNIHLTTFSYSHYDFWAMKKVPTGITPIVAIYRNSPKAMHQQIYDAYRIAIVNRSLRAGQRIPSTRTLASDLGVSRIPVLNAYAQLLAEGYFESRVGAGTCVSSSLPDQIAAPDSRNRRPVKTRSGPRPISKRAALLPAMKSAPWLRGWGAFGVSQVAYEHFPFQVWSSLVYRHSRNISAKSLDYGDPMGSKDLRETIATYLRTARGVRCDAQQVMIVSGSQQALEVTARVLFDPGSRVWVEDPGYRFARDVFLMNGCKLVPVPVDYEGLNVVAGIKRYRKARAAFVSPSHQYPLGATMSASRRLQLLDWAQDSGSWIIEDDYDSEYRYGSMPIPSLQGLDNNGRVIYIGTFSKVLFPSLRLGYLVIPPDLVERFFAIRVPMDIGPPDFHQRVLADFIKEGHFSRHIRRMRLLYNERCTVLIECLRKEFGFTADIVGGQGGMHLSITLPKTIKDREIATIAGRQNLWLLPLSTTYLEVPSRQGFILGFGSTTVKEMPHKVRKLRELLAAV
jgi:GntR family transcriptional regulator / MocR family aminotransferase